MFAKNAQNMLSVSDVFYTVKPHSETTEILQLPHYNNHTF